MDTRDVITVTVTNTWWRDTFNRQYSKMATFGVVLNGLKRDVGAHFSFAIPHT
jgi:hypothetical protein